MEWYIGVLKKYAVFTGRARRKEYWMFILFNCIVGFAIGLVGGILGVMSDTLSGITIAILCLYCLAILIPALAVTVRRLHDTGRSGWWLLISFVPLIGSLILLVFYVLDSQPGDNEYGPNPKGAAA